MPEQETLFAELLHQESSPVPGQAAAGKKGGKSGLKRRKKAKREVEDYYALLEINQDAAAAEIKRGYLQKIRQYPPENYPVEFEQIRKAYETLRDAELRKEYDIVRQYGESIQDLMEEAVGGKGITAQSVKLLERAVKIDPSHVRARLALAYAYISRGNDIAFQGHFYELMRQAEPDKRLEIKATKIMQLLRVGRTTAAFDELQKVTAAQPDAIKKIWPVYINVYGAACREDELLAELEAAVKAIEIPEPADAELYSAWIQAVNAFDEGGRKADRVLSTAKKWLKNFTNTADLVHISKIFLKKYEKCREETDYYGAKIFIDLAGMADRKNPDLRQYAQEIQTIVQILREVDRIFEDERLFPGIIIEVLRWVGDEFHVLEDELEEMSYWLPPEFHEEMLDMDEAYAAGILLLKKRYPVIYRHYQQRWEALFKEKTAGLNREERRSLRL
ncbi:DnaJ domain-containing protein [Sporomusa acidovorans]|uniref:Chaperone protein DnaJ n=1 Tax=Sporomusa acidovorans (strain ATCC 49682 / DSM 3132 / Mol) TaxID=1123286 RepID=A0ABZ3IYP3_SPOA4|nr:DnaJ domain-containing protein [Sporomusa acidovorans]OZC22191.1 chaperone protein DnaJ [Sporomusa acidovorans DSM 3132]SDE81865.1 DnaJ domain-containing protein [Sporomusa acidovorans]